MAKYFYSPSCLLLWELSCAWVQQYFYSSPPETLHLCSDPKQKKSKTCCSRQQGSYATGSVRIAVIQTFTRVLDPRNHRSGRIFCIVVWVVLPSPKSLDSWPVCKSYQYCLPPAALWALPSSKSRTAIQSPSLPTSYHCLLDLQHSPQPLPPHCSSLPIPLPASTGSLLLLTGYVYTLINALLPLRIKFNTSNVRY